MSNGLETALRRRPRHAIAVDGIGLPEGRPDLYIWGYDGIFKRGTSRRLDLLIRVAETPRLDGLARLAPYACWGSWPESRLPASLLEEALALARGACVDAGGHYRLTEWQGFIVPDGDEVGLAAPAPLEATATTVRAERPDGPVLVDIHSHHGLPPTFSRTDDADDLGLGVSVVIGEIFCRPRILCRLNVYGHRQLVPVTLLFDGLGPFEDALGRGAG